MNKYLVLGIIIAGIFIFIGVLVWQVGLKGSIDNNISEKSAKIDVSDWKIYRSEKYGFQIKYPESEENYKCHATSGPTPYFYERNILCAKIAHGFKDKIAYLDLGIMVNDKEDSTLTQCNPLPQPKEGFEGPEKITINGVEFCRSIFHIGAAGQRWTDYFYVTEKDGNYLSFFFLVDHGGGCDVCGATKDPEECRVNCVNFSEYKGEVEKFLSSILSTLEFID